MATPVGTLVSDSTQTKDQAGVTFVIWILATLAFFIIIFGMLTVSAEDSSAVHSQNNTICYFPVLLPAFGLIIAGINLFRQSKKLEIYTDGFILRNAKDNNIVEAGLWREVKDITWSQDRRKSTNSIAGYALFGIVGALIASNLTESPWENSQRDLYILRANKRRITLGVSFVTPQKPNVPLMNATGKAWLYETVQALKSGKDVAFGNIQVSVAGVKQGNTFVAWKAVIGAKPINQDGKVGIIWKHPTKKKPQIMSVRLGLRGNALIQLVNNRVRKNIESSGGLSPL